MYPHCLFPTTLWIRIYSLGQGNPCKTSPKRCYIVLALVRLLLPDLDLQDERAIAVVLRSGVHQQVDLVAGGQLVEVEVQALPRRLLRNFVLCLVQRLHRAAIHRRQCHQEVDAVPALGEHLFGMPTRLPLEFIHFVSYRIIDPSSTLDPISTIAFPVKNDYYEGPFSKP